MLYQHDSGQHRERAERLQKYERDQRVGVNPSMSVKGFITKYFGTVSEVTDNPVSPPAPLAHIPPNPTLVAPKTFHIFTDGACSDNGRRGARGGFGVHFYSKKGANLDISEPLLNNEPQTNNRGELRAIQAALDRIDQKQEEWSAYNDYCIWSDSEYSIHCLTKWASGWRRNGWRKSDGGIIQNIDLIRPIYEKLSRMPRVRLQHVRAHQKGRENEFPYDGNTEADRLARASIQPKLF